MPASSASLVTGWVASISRNQARLVWSSTRKSLVAGLHSGESAENSRDHGASKPTLPSS